MSKILYPRSLGSSNPLNVARATVKALQALKLSAVPAEVSEKKETA
ncbi:MAG: hypothetical protein WDN67_01655 [Candidatus Moraniibacteriota bacterium]